MAPWDLNSSGRRPTCCWGRGHTRARRRQLTHNPWTPEPPLAIRIRVPFSLVGPPLCTRVSVVLVSVWTSRNSDSFQSSSSIKHTIVDLLFLRYAVIHNEFIAVFFFFCVPKAMLRRPVLFSPGNLLSVEGTPSVPKVSRLGPLDMARFIVSGCYVMGTTEECVQVFENLYHMDIHQCGQIWVCRGGRVGDSERSSL